MILIVSCAICVLLFRFDITKCLWGTLRLVQQQRRYDVVRMNANVSIDGVEHVGEDEPSPAPEAKTPRRHGHLRLHVITRMTSKQMRYRHRLSRINAGVMGGGESHDGWAVAKGFCPSPPRFTLVPQATEFAPRATRWFGPPATFLTNRIHTRLCGHHPLAISGNSKTITKARWQFRVAYPLPKADQVNALGNGSRH